MVTKAVARHLHRPRAILPVEVLMAGTRMYCPFCEKDSNCEAKGSGEDFAPEQRRERAGIKWFQRGRECLVCKHQFITAEVDLDVLERLIQQEQDRLKQEQDWKVEKGSAEALQDLEQARDTAERLHGHLSRALESEWLQFEMPD